MVAITFDDGPSRNTAKIVDILRTHEASATFFFVGKRMTRGSFDASAVLQVGEVGNHTWRHSKAHPWKKLSYSQAKQEIRDTSSRILNRTGQKCVWFRSVGLKRTKASDRAMRDSNVRFVGGVLVNDWGKGRGNKAAAIRQRVTKKAAGNHTVLILHETNNETVKALPGILDWYRRHGYQVVTVSQLMNSR